MLYLEDFDTMKIHDFLLCIPSYNQSIQKKNEQHKQFLFVCGRIL